MDDDTLDRVVRGALAPSEDAVSRVVANAVAMPGARGRPGLVIGVTCLAVAAVVVLSVTFRHPAPATTKTAHQPHLPPTMPVVRRAAPPVAGAPAADAPGASAVAAGARVRRSRLRLSNVDQTVVVETPSGTWLMGGSRGTARRPRNGGSIVMIEPGGER